jgi:hypothetical protein
VNTLYILFIIMERQTENFAPRGQNSSLGNNFPPGKQLHHAMGNNFTPGKQLESKFAP